MFTVLTDIFHGILELPYLLLNLVIESINGWILGLASILKGIVALLPGFPDRPPLAGTGVDWLVWWIPVEAMLGAFAVMLGAWVLWMGYTVIMKKIGMIS